MKPREFALKLHNQGINYLPMKRGQVHGSFISVSSSMFY